MKLKTLFLIVSCFVIASAQAAGNVIDDIQVKGNRVIDASMIELQASSARGSVIDAATIDKDIKEIYRTGFFKNVAARVSSEGGKTILVFEVTEKPAIKSVFLEGNEEVDEDTFKEKMGASVKRFLDERKIKAGIEAVISYYQEKGYYGTEIDYTIKEIDESQVEITFNVKEGKEKLIREVVFEGNKGIDSDELQNAIKTSRYKWWNSWIYSTGVVKKDILDNDVKLLSQQYLTKGYVDVRVTEPVVEDVPDGLKVTFKVEEGPIYKVGRISASGSLVDNDQAKTLDGVTLKSNETFNVENLRKDVFTVSSKFTDVGYAFANVSPETKIDREARLVNINFFIDKGALVYIDRIDVTGNKKTLDNVVRRNLKIDEGELYSSSKVQRSQELLQRQGYFDEVTITPDPSIYEDKTNLVVSVKEGQTGTFTIGAGVSSGDGFIFMSKLSENNFLGTGRNLSLDLDSGSRRENYILSLTDPRINDTQWSGTVEGGLSTRVYDDFERRETGGSVTVGYPLWFLGEDYLDDIRFATQYQLQRINITDVDEDAPQLIKDQEGVTTNSSVTPKLIRNTINNPLDPTSGSRQTVGIELAGVGGDQKFWLLNLANSFYYPLWQPSFGPFVFANRVKLGYGKTYNGEDFPVFRRFFPGGINSVRGYETAELGPKDENGNEYGGNKQLIGNFEVIFPLIESVGLRGVVFYDVGNAFDDQQEIEIGELRQAAGFGFRWRSPLAPIRIEFGLPIDREDGEKNFVTNFTFGMPQ